MADHLHTKESGAAPIGWLAAGRFRLGAIGVGAVLVTVGSFMPWISFSHIGSLQVVVEQSGIELGYGLVTVACGIGLTVLTVQAARGKATIPIGIVMSLAGAALATLAATAALVMLRPGGSYAEHGGAYLDLAFFGTGIGAWTAAVAALRPSALDSMRGAERALVVTSLVGWGVLLVGVISHTVLAYGPVDRQPPFGSAVVALALIMAVVLLTVPLRAALRRGTGGAGA